MAPPADRVETVSAELLGKALVDRQVLFLLEGVQQTGKVQGLLDQGLFGGKL